MKGRGEKKNKSQNLLKVILFKLCFHVWAMSSKAHFCQQWVVNSRSLGRAFPYFYPNLESKNGLVEPKVKKILCGWGMVYLRVGLQPAKVFRLKQTFVQ